MATKFFEKLSSNLSDLLLNENEYNVIIKVGQAPDNKVFKAHSVILNSRCLYFKDKLRDVAYENGVKTIKETDILIETFDIIIKYIYDGTISLEKVDASVIFDLLIASNEFSLGELVKHIQLFLIENNASWLRLNFSRIFKVSFENNFNDLQHFCTNIIAKYPNIVFDSDEFITLSENALVSILKLDNLQMDEGLIWDHVIRWGIAQNPSLIPNPKQWSDEDFLVMKNTLQNCLSLIRYFQISGNDIFKKVRPYQKILDPNLWEDIEMKFMIPDQTVNSHILPPRNPSSTSLPSRSNQLLTIITDDNENEMELNNIYELRKRGKYYFKMKRYNDALEYLNKALKIRQDNESKLDSILNKRTILYIRGKTYFMMSKYEEALSDLNELNNELEFKPEMLWVREMLFYAMGRHKEALSDLIKLLEINPNNTEFLICRGGIYRTIGKHKEAIIDSSRVLEVDPNEMRALAIRGLTYRLIGSDKEAFADLNKLNGLLQIDQNDAPKISDRGDAYCCLGMYEEALADFTKALEIVQHPIYFLNRAIVYHIMEKYEKALVELTNAELSNADLTNEAEVYINMLLILGIRGITYRSMGRHNEAYVNLKKLNKFLEFELNNARVLVSRGRTYLMMGRYEDALRDLTKSLEILPNYVFALVYRGETYRIMGKYNEALADLTKSLEVCPNDAEALKAHKKLMIDMNKI